MQTHSTTTEYEAKVLDLVHAINEERFDEAAGLLTDDFKFEGVMGTRNGCEAYIKDLKKMKIKYKIHKILADESDVCALCDYVMDGKTLLGCNWYTLRNGRISSLRAIFDPRPLLEKK
ncbi:MAG TPA: nuclear transport factor 2 family protein [Puia sp.]|jgi:hypothetical protein